MCGIYADFAFIKINGANSLLCCVGNKDKSYFLTLKVPSKFGESLRIVNTGLVLFCGSGLIVSGDYFKVTL